MMTSLALILPILPIHLAVMVSPGPNSVLLLTIALSSGRISALRAAVGIAVGSLIWMVGAVAGVSVVLDLLPVLGMALQIAGGGYLIHLGLKLWSAGMMVPDALGPSDSPHSNSFRRGFIASLTNPKSAAYFGSIFAAFLTTEVPTTALVVITFLLFFMSLVWHGALATTFSAKSFRTPYVRHSQLINRIAGGVLVVLGVKLAASAWTGL